ncbi:biopolymer transport protein ExbB [Verrucomicrobium sp. GAS474]|uniref:MotA/TolQ/ExbB proton channel family protein n=1 Tax=Verrucomicrobium sp. GAS474 TaxID=1882831 RepID=UPI00087948E4|nr:MotA/TolQ/ExbB proton channel family protein [Verrucomicrobium sp. GAS474]SDU23410.1 biopolymer transport protein ExbB [Verrucomicrobium sp. GAS474]
MTSLFYPLLAQAASTPASAPTDVLGPVSALSLWELLKAGGLVMMPLFLASIAAVFLIGYYFFTLRRKAITQDELENRIDAYLADEDLSGLAAYLKDRPEALAEVLSKVLEFTYRRKDADPDAIAAIAESEGARIAAMLNQRVVYLLDIGVLSPMLGLFGTVVGILRSFGTIATEALTMRTMMLAGGVSQALVATAAGLIVGIASMFFYSYFRGRVQSLISVFEVATTARVQEIILMKKRR